MMWLSGFLVDNWWAGIALWATLFVLDYVRTIRGARRYNSLLKKYAEIEGSFELNPFYEKDVDALRTVSPRSFLTLGLTVIMLYVAWSLAPLVPAFGKDYYLFLLGVLCLPSVVVHIRHINNLQMYAVLVKNPDAIRGKVIYSRRYSMINLSTQYLCFASLYLFLFLLVGSWFIAGGALATAIHGFRFSALARKFPATAPALSPAANADAGFKSST